MGNVTKAKKPLNTNGQNLGNLLRARQRLLNLRREMINIRTQLRQLQGRLRILIKTNTNTNGFNKRAHVQQVVREARNVRYLTDMFESKKQESNNLINRYRGIENFI